MRIVVRLVQAAVLAMVVVVGVSIFRSGPHVAKPVARTDGDVVLGPDGVGKLELGMSEEQATATGQLRVSPDWKSTGKATCFIATAGGTSYQFSRHHGLAVITVPDHFRTPEGIRPGANLTEVALSYPTLSHPEFGSPRRQVQMFGEFTAPVPDNPDAIYIFVFRPGKGAPLGGAPVRYVLLSLRDQDEECTHAT
jgi:hypothetical protein